jgi:catechol 2,3-dioxygenase-like lactoylglutathione lyase family enzyme
VAPVAIEPGIASCGGRPTWHDGLEGLYDAEADGDPAPKGPNPEHIYFAVADLDAVFARAERLGGLLDQIGDGGLPMGRTAVRPWGERSFYLQDPFGNPLCFVDEATVFTGT